jgi:hypothetical protein
MATTDTVSDSVAPDDKIQLGPARLSRRGAFRLRAVVAGLTGVVLFLTVLLASAGVLVDKSFY